MSEEEEVGIVSYFMCFILVSVYNNYALCVKSNVIMRCHGGILSEFVLVDLNYKTSNKDFLAGPNSITFTYDIDFPISAVSRMFSS